ncbi:MAG: copper chaperone PCu(A)C [Alphaproteobacteria bacterium]|nr:copper chaperone PCu(A)C [Alphaproteobacteria bacterium]
MNKRAFLFSLVFLALVFASADAWAKNKNVSGTLVISKVFVRPTVPNSLSSAAYMEIANNSDKQEKLISASSPDADQIELIKIMRDHGMRRMHEVDDILVPPHSVVPLKLGTYHLMLIGVKKPLVVGDTVRIELKFAQAGKVILNAPVAEIRARKHKQDR